MPTSRDLLVEAIDLPEGILSRRGSFADAFQIDRFNDLIYSDSEIKLFP
jgi:hypothetical protein